MRKNALRYLMLCFLGLVAFGCNSTDTVGTHPVPQNNPVPFPGYTFPLVDLTNGIIPLPNNLLLNPQTGLINLELDPGQDPNVDSTKTAANSLDGFSTTAPIVIPFRGTVTAESLSMDTLPVFDTTTGQKVPATYSLESNQTGSVVVVTPVRPMKPGTTHVVVLTQGIISALSGTPILSDNVINFLQQPTPLVDEDGTSITLGLSDEQAQALEPVRLANQAVIGAAETLTETNRANIPFAFAFTTQTLQKALPMARAKVLEADAGFINLAVNAITPEVPPGYEPGVPVAVAGGVPGVLPSIEQFLAQRLGLPVSDPQVVTLANGIGAIYYGAIPVPQFRADPTKDYWANPPVQTGTTNVPFLLFTPAIIPTPAQPFPVVIYQHGLGADKSSAFVLAGPLNAQGRALIAPDLPLHGDLATPGGQGGLELLNPSTPRVARDNIRQGVVTLYTLANAVKTGKVFPAFTVPANAFGAGSPPVALPLSPPLATTNPQFIGVSLGAIVGTNFVATEPNVDRSVLNVPGGRITYLLLESEAYSQTILDGLAAAGVTPGTAAFVQFGLFTQAVLDDVDPLNVAEAAISGSLRGGTGVNLLQQLATADTVIPPSAQYDLAISFGANSLYKQIAALLPQPLIAQATAPSPGPGLFEVANADHGFLLRPTAAPAGTQAAAIGQTIGFLLTGQVTSTGLRAQQAFQAVGESCAELLARTGKLF